MSAPLQSHLCSRSWTRPYRRTVSERYCARQSRCLCVCDRKEPQRLRNVSFTVAISRNGLIIQRPRPSSPSLQQRKISEWKERVELLFGDMRSLALPEPADIVVSELLGSFGDNELSPECLDGAMRFLKRRSLGLSLCPMPGFMAFLANGISIPSSYSAYLAPLSSSKLYNEVRAGKDDKAWETPYVVMFHAVNILSSQGGGDGGRCGSQIQECWEFEHPRRDVVLNDRGRSSEIHAGPVVSRVC
jgi:hypothetical protein